MSEQKIDHWWHIGFTALGVILIATALIYYVRGNAKTGEAKSWMPAPGMILNAWIQEADQSGGLMFGWIPTMMKVYFPRVEYGYHVGVERRGTSAFLAGRRFVTRDQANQWLATVPPNARTTVWYNPRNPDQSALVINGPALGVAVTVALTGAAVIFFGYLFTPFAH